MWSGRLHEVMYGMSYSGVQEILIPLPGNDEIFIRAYIILKVKIPFRDTGEPTFI